MGETLIESEKRRIALWELVVAQVRKRARGRCEMCGKQEKETPMRVHHIRNMQKGGAKYGPHNLAFICEECKTRLRKREAEGKVLPQFYLKKEN